MIDYNTILVKKLKHIFINLFYFFIKIFYLSFIKKFKLSIKDFITIFEFFI